MKTTDMKMFYGPSSPLHSEHSDAQLWYFCFSPTDFIG